MEASALVETTTCTLNAQSYEGCYAHTAALHSAIECGNKALERIGVDYIDLYVFRRAAVNSSVY